MQKVVGSSPIIRFESPAWRGFLLPSLEERGSVALQLGGGELDLDVAALELRPLWAVRDPHHPCRDGGASVSWCTGSSVPSSHRTG